MSTLPQNDSSKQSRPNRCGFAKVSLHALQSQVHAGTKTARLSGKPAQTSGRDVCRWPELAQDWATTESSPSDCCDRTVALWIVDRAETSPNAPMPQEVKEAEMDELFTFIGDKKNRIYVLTIVDRQTRWLPQRFLVVVADSSFAVIDLLWQLRQLKNPICMITRFRLDAALYEPAKVVPGAKGRPRKKGARLPTLETVAADKQTRWKRLTVQQWYGEKKRLIEITSNTAVWYHTGHPPLPIRWVLVRDPKQIFKTQALLCTDLSVSAKQIVQWFVRRWQVEVTFHEVRTHLGVETQRQWADLSILRMTPALLGLFSMITLLANLHARHQKLPVQHTAWYPKKLPTFSDALSIVKETLFMQHYFPTSLFHANIRKPQPTHPVYHLPRSLPAFSAIPFG